MLDQDWRNWYQNVLVQNSQERHYLTVFQNSILRFLWQSSTSEFLNKNKIVQNKSIKIVMSIQIIYFQYFLCQIQQIKLYFSIQKIIKDKINTCYIYYRDLSNKNIRKFITMQQQNNQKQKQKPKITFMSVRKVGQQQLISMAGLNQQKQKQAVNSLKKSSNQYYERFQKPPSSQNTNRNTKDKDNSNIVNKNMNVIDHIQTIFKNHNQSNLSKVSRQNKFMPTSLNSPEQIKQQTNAKDNTANLNIDQLINCFTLLQNGFLSNFVAKFKQLVSKNQKLIIILQNTQKIIGNYEKIYNKLRYNSQERGLQDSVFQKKENQYSFFEQTIETIQLVMNQLVSKPFDIKTSCQNLNKHEKILNVYDQAIKQVKQTRKQIQKSKQNELKLIEISNKFKVQQQKQLSLIKQKIQYTETIKLLNKQLNDVKNQNTQYYNIVLTLQQNSINLNRQLKNKQKQCELMEQVIKQQNQKQNSQKQQKNKNIEHQQQINTNLKRQLEGLKIELSILQQKLSLRQSFVQKQKPKLKKINNNVKNVVKNNQKIKKSLQNTSKIRNKAKNQVYINQNPKTKDQKQTKRIKVSKQQSKNIWLNTNQLQEQIQKYKNQNSQLRQYLLQLENQAEQQKQNYQNTIQARFLQSSDIIQYDEVQKKVNIIQMFYKFNCSPVQFKLLYKFNKKVTSNFHNYIDNKPNIFLLIQLQNEIVIGGFSFDALSPTSQSKNGFIFSLTYNKTYQLKNQKQAVCMMYDPYYIIFGNGQIRIKLNQNFVYSNFGVSASYFDSQKDTIMQFLYGQKSNKQVLRYSRQMAIKRYEFYEVVFQN